MVSPLDGFGVTEAHLEFLKPLCTANNLVRQGKLTYDEFVRLLTKLDALLGDETVTFEGKLIALWAGWYGVTGLSYQVAHEFQIFSTYHMKYRNELLQNVMKLKELEKTNKHVEAELRAKLHQTFNPLVQNITMVPANKLVRRSIFIHPETGKKVMVEANQSSFNPKYNSRIISFFELDENEKPIDSDNLKGLFIPDGTQLLKTLAVPTTDIWVDRNHNHPDAVPMTNPVDVRTVPAGTLLRCYVVVDGKYEMGYSCVLLCAENGRLSYLTSTGDIESWEYREESPSYIMFVMTGFELHTAN